MTVCYELQDSMSGSVTQDMEAGETRTVKRRYLIGQCDGFNAAVAAIEQYSPRYVNGDGAGLYWVRRQLDVTAVGNKYFDCVANYETLIANSSGGQPNSSDAPAPGSIAWDTTGSTEHITQGISPETSYPNDAATFHGAINVSGDSVNGLDVVRPGLKYSETWIIPAQIAISYAFVGAIYKCTGTVNATPFRAFQPGEALFLGARAQWSGDSPYVAVTFEFEARPNVDTFYVEGITGFPKKGWQHVWIRYQADTNNNQIVKKPLAAYLNDVYEQKNWAGILIDALTIGGQKYPTDPIPPNQFQQ